MIYYYMNMYNCNVLPKVIQLNTNVISILKGTIMVEICIREQVFFFKIAICVLLLYIRSMWMLNFAIQKCHDNRYKNCAFDG